MSKCAEFKFDLICEIIFDKFFPGLTGIRTHAHACIIALRCEADALKLCRSRLKAIMVITVRAHCYPLDIYIYIYKDSRS